ncbi:hypothetical protein NQ314_016971 [Rhamnusium bicolor]|uniref:Enoyl reductase (ER) domain-containing protein n=1 Tax=Rhamnusium bicolor TaxID=1586634 RepID=A0AAV8WV68_9CUCU|nr:hypothetical protein NQ314_016971 [Rhamnusium bicolor]
MEVQKCRSVIVKNFGGYESLLVEHFNLPQLEGNIEIRVDYGGINFADLYTRQGLLLDKKLPFVLGMECTGTITAIGSKQTELKVGQKVICYDYKGGMYRDIIRVNPEKCGVGCAATQLAKTVKDVKIFGTGSRQKESEAKINGVDVFYPNEDFQIKVENGKFDIIITNETGPKFTFLQNHLSPLGRIILIGTLIERDAEKVKTALHYIFDLYRNGKINPKIHSSWPMSKIIEATKILGERKMWEKF